MTLISMILYLFIRVVSFYTYKQYIKEGTYDFKYNDSILTLGGFKFISLKPINHTFWNYWYPVSLFHSLTMHTMSLHKRVKYA